MADTKEVKTPETPAVDYKAVYDYIVDTLSKELTTQEAALSHTANCFDYLKTSVSVDAVKSILTFVKNLTAGK